MINSPPPNVRPVGHRSPGRVALRDLPAQRWSSVYPLGGTGFLPAFRIRLSRAGTVQTVGRRFTIGAALPTVDSTHDSPPVGRPYPQAKVLVYLIGCRFLHLHPRIYGKRSVSTSIRYVGHVALRHTNRNSRSFSSLLAAPYMVAPAENRPRRPSRPPRSQVMCLASSWSRTRYGS